MKLHNKNSNLKEGVFLEMLVECFQNLFAEDGLKVSRNQKYYDKKGILIGEVDVVIEGVYKSQFLKIGTECRDRNGAQGRNWIRQIIGKKFDLADKGFTHWIAISSGGFKPTAVELARRGGIQLLVPASAKAVEPEKDFLSKFTERLLIFVQKEYSSFETEIECDDDTIDYVEAQIKLDLGKIYLKVEQQNSESITMADFIDKKSSEYLSDLQNKNKDSKFKTYKLMEFNDLDAVVENKLFKFKVFKIGVTFIQKIYKPNFKVMGIFIPIENEPKLLGMIFINEYLNNSEIGYLMFAMKQGELDKFRAVVRTPDGKPVKNQTVTFY